MKNKILKTLICIIFCWGILVAVEGFRLIGSTDPGRYPILNIGSTQTQNELARYISLGFSQTYYLSDGDSFVCGEFKVLGIRISRWYS